MKEVQSQPHQPQTAPRIDDVDVKILRFLASDSRMSQRAIARAVSMSPPAVADRIDRLETAGVITGYHATLNYAALGRPMTVLVEVTSDRSSTQMDLAQRLIAIPEIEYVEVVTGTADLMIRMRVRDQAHLKEVLLNSVLQSSADIRHTTTNLALVTIRPDSFDDRLLEAIGDSLAQDNTQHQGS